MQYQKVTEEYKNAIKEFLPGLSVDCVIITYEDDTLKVLLLNWKNTDVWGLPGGFIRKDEDLERAAARLLKERTGLDYPFLSQFYTFGDVQRRDPVRTQQLLTALRIDAPEVLFWISQRFVTTGYFALVNRSLCGDPEPDLFSSKCEWVPINRLPGLVFDHRQIIEKAIEHIRIRVNYLPLGINLLPETFTMKELQRLYEVVLGKRLDRSNFQRKMLNLGILVRLNKKPDAGAHKAPYLYRFDRKKYKELNRKGIGFNLLQLNDKEK